MLKVQVANTPYLLEKGLMFLDHLPEDEGMLFIFKKAQKLSFWGKNTLLDLDIAFIDSDNYIKKISSIEKMDLSPVGCNSDCIMALECNKDYFKDNGINVGDKISLNLEGKVSGQYYPKYANINFIKPKVKISQNQNDVDKKNETPKGIPITENDSNNNQLPVIGIQDINNILEDSYDDTVEDVTPDNNDIQSDPFVDNTPETETEPTVEVQPIVEEKQQEYPVFNTAYEAFDWANKNQESLRISYITKKGRNLIRDVCPHGIFYAESSKKNIGVTWDETVGAIRAFILTNVYEWAFLEKKFNKRFIFKR